MTRFASVALAESPGDYQVRPPVACRKVDHPPSREEVRFLLTCSRDLDDPSHGTFYREEVATVEVGAPRAYTYGDPGSREADPSAPVYPIRGEETFYVCSPVSRYMANAGKNCSAFTSAGTGICYRTPFSDWKCVLRGNRIGTRFNVAGPQ